MTGITVGRLPSKIEPRYDRGEARAATVAGGRPGLGRITFRWVLRTGYNGRTEVTLPSLRAVFSNLSVQMPLGRKLQRIFVNNWIKIRTRSSCCGNYGEPGC